MELKDCKVILKDFVVAHHLVVMDLRLTIKKIPKRKTQGVEIIKWFKLREPDLGRCFKDTVLEKIIQEISNINAWRKQTADIMLGHDKDILGEGSNNKKKK